MNEVTFIGVDLAWRSERHPTGIAVLQGDEAGARLIGIDSLSAGTPVIDYIREAATPNTVVAIDAPLIITNEVGQRLCEAEIGRRYGARHASCHTSNLALYKNAASVVLTIQLLKEGFFHFERNNPQQFGRFVVEVYPHAAMVALWNLETIIKYKKGSVQSRREGLKTLQKRIGALTQAQPRLIASPEVLDFLNTSLDPLRGRELKSYEDRLDALFCAYLAYYFWYSATEQTEMFGDINDGYVLNPSPSHRRSSLPPRARLQ